MYLAHSNIAAEQSVPAKKQRAASSYIERIEHRLWTKAIAKTLKKYDKEIKEIQQKHPGWMPVFKKP